MIFLLSVQSCIFPLRKKTAWIIRLIQLFFNSISITALATQNEASASTAQSCHAKCTSLRSSWRQHWVQWWTQWAVCGSSPWWHLVAPSWVFCPLASWSSIQEIVMERRVSRTKLLPIPAMQKMTPTLRSPVS